MALAVAIAAARIEAQITRAEEARFAARQAALDGLNYAAWRIVAEDAGQIEKLSTYVFSINGYQVVFKPSLESEKLDINLASEATIASFFSALGLENDDASQLAARIADWRDEDDLARPNGAEARDYASARNGEKIGDRQFYSIDELKFVLGAPHDVVDCALPALTIFGDGSLPSSSFMQTLYGRDLEHTKTASGARLGTASRSAAAGRRYAITATANSESDIGQTYDLTGVFRIIGGRERPYEWIAQFESQNTKPEAIAECAQHLATAN